MRFIHPFLVGPSIVVFLISGFSSLQLSFGQFGQFEGNLNDTALQGNQTQNQNQTQLVAYVNYENGVLMLYPPEWTVSYASSYPGFVEFYSPLNNLSDFTEPAQVVLSLQTYQQNITLADYTNQTVGALSGMALQLSENQTQAPISVRSSEPVTLAGYPGHRITYTILDSQTQASFVTMQLWTVVDGNKVYTVTYGAEGNDKFMTHLPDATQMINSLGIANSTATT